MINIYHVPVIQLFSILHSKLLTSNIISTLYLAVLELLASCVEVVELKIMITVILNYIKMLATLSTTFGYEEKRKDGSKKYEATIKYY